MTMMMMTMMMMMSLPPQISHFRVLADPQGFTIAANHDHDHDCHDDDDNHDDEDDDEEEEDVYTTSDQPLQGTGISSGFYYCCQPPRIDLPGGIQRIAQPGGENIFGLNFLTPYDDQIKI